MAKRRGVMGALAAGTLAAGGLPPGAARAQPAPRPSQEALRERVLAHMQGFPGTQAIKVLAPAADGRPEFRIDVNSKSTLFIGSAIKAFVLCERLRQLDGPGIIKALTAAQLALDESVWSVDSVTFNPPHLSGQVTERTVLEAMIRHSDNTATDMALKQAGPDRVRQFLADAGLHSSQVPDSTRVFFGYLLGANDFKRFTWAELQAAADKPIVNPPLNPFQTLASSADDLVSFYQRSMGGEFFKSKETLDAYRSILSIGDVVNAAFPLGATAFAKGGSIDVPGFHALCLPGAAFFAGRWVYLAMIINWPALGETDPDTVARYVGAARGALADLVQGLA